METSDAEMASWDIHHSDLVHLANTTQMQKLVPEPRRYKSVVIKQGAFKQRCYATMGACGPLSTFPIRPHRTQSMRSLGNTIFSSSQGTGAGVSGAASGALSGGATVNTMASGGHTVNTAATASSADDTNMLDVEVKVGDEVDDRAAAGMVSRAASGSGAAPVGAGGAAGAIGAAAPAAAPSTPHPEHQPRSMLLDKDVDDAAQPKPSVPTAVAATASAAVVAPACLHGAGQGTDAAGPSEAPCVASAAAALGVDASTTATSAWHATDTSTDQHDAKGTAGPGPQAKSNDLHAPIPFGGVLHPPPGAVHGQPPALQEQQSVRGAASCNPAVASKGAATPTASHAGVPMEHAAQPLSDQGDGSGNAGILGVQPQAQAPCGLSASPGQHVDDGDDGSDAVMQETREGPEQSQGKTEPATDTSRHSPPPAALEPPDKSHAGMQGDDLEQGQGQHTASPSQQPAVTAGGTGQEAAAHAGSADANGNGLHQKPEAAAIAPAAGSAAANGNACMDAAITGGQDEVKVQCTDEPGCGSQQLLPATASGPAPGQ